MKRTCSGCCPECQGWCVQCGTLLHCFFKVTKLQPSLFFNRKKKPWRKLHSGCKVEIFNIFSSNCSFRSEFPLVQSCSLWSLVKMKQEKPWCSLCMFWNQQGLGAKTLNRPPRKKALLSKHFANLLWDQQSPTPQSGFGGSRFNLRKGQLQMCHLGL